MRTARVSSRRVPRRRSSKEIVDAIVEGAMRILGSEGYERLTTNRIAETAGVSIGSLYQYFPSKQGILAAIARGLERRAFDILAHVFAGAAQLDFREVTRTIVEQLSSERLGNLDMRREILNHVPRSWTAEASHEVDDQVHTVLAAYLHQHPAVNKRNPDLSAFIVMHAVEAILEAAVARRPELLRDPEFFEEVTELVTTYLALEQGARADAH